MSEDKNSRANDNPPPPAAKKKRKFRGEVYITTERCKGCGFCVAFCPTGTLTLSKSYNAKGYHPPEVVDMDTCTGCGLCGMYCPDFAIFGIRIKIEGTGEEAGSAPEDIARKKKGA